MLSHRILPFLTSRQLLGALPAQVLAGSAPPLSGAPFADDDGSGKVELGGGGLQTRAGQPGELHLRPSQRLPFLKVALAGSWREAAGWGRAQGLLVPSQELGGGSPGGHLPFRDGSGKSRSCQTTPPPLRSFTGISHVLPGVRRKLPGECLRSRGRQLRPGRSTSEQLPQGLSRVPPSQAMSGAGGGPALPRGLVSHLDHVVMTVRSIEDTAAFYSRVLGLEVATFQVCVCVCVGTRHPVSPAGEAQGLLQPGGREAESGGWGGRARSPV